MLNVTNITSENNPLRPSSEASGPEPLPATQAKLTDYLQIAVAVIVYSLSAWPKRLADRMFAANDAEAFWRGWQIVRVHGGLDRRYRDPRFDTLPDTLPSTGPADVAPKRPEETM